MIRDCEIWLYRSTNIAADPVDKISVVCKTHNELIVVMELGLDFDFDEQKYHKELKEAVDNHVRTYEDQDTQSENIRKITKPEEEENARSTTTWTDTAEPRRSTTRSDIR